MSDEKFGFLTPLRVESVDAKNWKYLEPFIWAGHKDKLVINEGEFTDFASVPFWTQIVLPRTGTWTKSAGVHDKMCNLLNEYYRLMKERQELIEMGGKQWLLLEPIKPVFNSIDTDYIFRLNAIDEGTDLIRAELLWFGVRCGAFWNPARREGWWKPRVVYRWFFDLIVILTVIICGLGFVSWLWPW